MILRALAPGDAGLLAPLHAAAYDRPWSAAEIEALARTPGVAVLAVHDAAGAPQGFVMARRVADEAEILTLAVAPGARRRGVARVLVEAAAGLGAASLFLEVAADNAAARALYAAAGFVEVGRRRGYYARADGPPVDALVLRRLTGALRPVILPSPTGSRP